MTGANVTDSAAWTGLLEQMRAACLPNQEYKTAIAGLCLFHLAAPAPMVRRFYTPSIALILQGEKIVTIGDVRQRLGSGAILLASIDIPTFAEVSAGSVEEPYLSLTLELDLQLVRDSMLKHDFAAHSLTSSQPGLAAGMVTPDLIAIFGRLLHLLDRPAEIAVMFDLIRRELIFRLLLSKEGTRLAQIARVDSHASRVLKAIDWLKENYALPFSMKELASVAGMGISTLHHRFRELTSMSPLQYQKSLRLHAARNLMLGERIDVGTAALRVGYESAAQFSREYARFFGFPPLRDIKAIRDLGYRDT